MTDELKRVCCAFRIEGEWASYEEISVDVYKRQCTDGPGADPVFAEPDAGRGAAGLPPDKKAGGQHPALHPGPAAGLPLPACLLYTSI